MERLKVKRLFLILSAVFVISLISTLTDTNSWHLSAFELGSSVGQMIGHLLRILVLLGLVNFFIRGVKIENLVLFVFSIFVISLLFTLIGLPSRNLSSFDLGVSVGQMMRQLFEKLFTVMLILVVFKKFSVKKLHTED